MRLWEQIRCVFGLGVSAKQWAQYEAIRERVQFEHEQREAALNAEVDRRMRDGEIEPGEALMMSCPQSERTHALAVRWDRFGQAEYFRGLPSEGGTPWTT